jgi:uncharacterized protein YceK
MILRCPFQRLRSSVPVLGAALAFGCGSIAVQVTPAEETGYDGPAIYSGTIYDVRGVSRSGSAEDESSIGVLLILDVPFSLVMDTILLPLTLYEQISGRWPLRREPEPQSSRPSEGPALPE